MDLFAIPDSAVPEALRALKTVAMANGRFDAPERAMLRAAASAYRVDADPDALGTIEPSELAVALPDATSREHVIQACMLMSLSDQDVAPSEVAVLSAFGAIHVPRLPDVGVPRRPSGPSGRGEDRGLLRRRSRLPRPPRRREVQDQPHRSLGFLAACRSHGGELARRVRRFAESRERAHFFISAAIIRHRRRRVVEGNHRYMASRIFLGIER